jgi:hypothetical protein
MAGEWSASRTAHEVAKGIFCLTACQSVPRLLLVRACTWVNIATSKRRRLALSFNRRS